VAQHGVDMARDVPAVLRTDVTPTPEIIGRDIVGRALAQVDRGQNVDRGGDLRARGQTAPECLAGAFVFVAPAQAGVQSHAQGVGVSRFPLSQE